MNAVAGVTPQTGAMRVFGCTVNGPVNLLDNTRIEEPSTALRFKASSPGGLTAQIWGNTNSFVLVMGATNGSPQNYASTLITSGAISCANSNAVSTGLVTEDAGWRFPIEWS